MLADGCIRKRFTKPGCAVTIERFVASDNFRSTRIARRNHLIGTRIASGIS